MHDAYIETAKGSLERATTRVNILVTSVASVTTLYTGLLALVYSSEKDTTPLSPSALLPAIFLGLSLFFVSIYASLFFSREKKVVLLRRGAAGEFTAERVAGFIDWCNDVVLTRIWALHTGIACFGVGIILLPAPFVGISLNLFPWVLVGGLMTVVIVVIAIELAARGAFRSRATATASDRTVAGR